MASQEGLTFVCVLCCHHLNVFKICCLKNAILVNNHCLFSFCHFICISNKCSQNEFLQTDTCKTLCVKEPYQWHFIPEGFSYFLHRTVTQALLLYLGLQA